MRSLDRPAWSPVWLAVGAVLAGGATYALLVVTARALGPAGYGQFSLFWAAVVITSLGCFLPVEQVVARRATAMDPTSRAVSTLLARAVRLSVAVAVLAVVLHALVWVATDHPDSLVLTVSAAFVLACLGFATQFPARGALAARRDLRSYAVVAVADAGIRGVAVVVLWLLDVTSVGAYALAVGASALVCGLLAVMLERRTRSHGGAPHAAGAEAPHGGPVAGPSVGREVGGLVVAMICMHGLLNSGVVIAGLVAAGRDAAAAGHVLAAITLARLPVFALQSAQAAYVSRIASHAYRRDRAALRSLMLRLAALVGVTAGGTVLIATTAGTFILRLVFGSDYDVAWPVLALVALGVATYVVGSVANDVVVALGAHARSGVIWGVSLAAAVVVAVLTPDLVLRTTLPLLVGSVVASAILVPTVVARVREVVPR